MQGSLLEILLTGRLRANSFFFKCAFRKEFITLDSAKTTQLEAWLVDENCMYPTIIYALTRLLLSTVLGPEFVNSMFRTGGDSGSKGNFRSLVLPDLDTKPVPSNDFPLLIDCPFRFFDFNCPLMCDKTNHEMW